VQVTIPWERSLLLFRAAGHNTLKEVLTPPQGCRSQYPERGPYSSPGLQVTVP